MHGCHICGGYGCDCLESIKTPDAVRIAKPSPFAALLPCSPASRQRRWVLGGYVSPLLQLATKILKKIRMIPGGSGKVSPSATPFADAVCRALHLCVDDAKPPLSPDEFEALYCEILEDEVRQGRNAAEIINRFMKERKK